MESKKNRWGVVILGVVIVLAIYFVEGRVEGVAIDLKVLNKAPEMKEGMEGPVTLRRVPPILDLQILNNSSETLFLESINLVAERISWNEPTTTCSGITAAPTEFYDIELDLDADNQKRQIQVLRLVEPQGNDRLLISLAPSVDSVGGSAEFLLTIDIKNTHGFKEYSLNPVSVSLKKVPGSCNGPTRIPGISVSGSGRN